MSALGRSMFIIIINNITIWNIEDIRWSSYNRHKHRIKFLLVSIETSFTMINALVVKKFLKKNNDKTFILCMHIHKKIIFIIQSINT